MVNIGSNNVGNLGGSQPIVKPGSVNQAAEISAKTAVGIQKPDLALAQLGAKLNDIAGPATNRVMAGVAQQA